MFVALDNYDARDVRSPQPPIGHPYEADPLDDVEMLSAEDQEKVLENQDG